MKLISVGGLGAASGPLWVQGNALLGDPRGEAPRKLLGFHIIYSLKFIL